MDKIIISDLRLPVIVGTLPEERTRRQEIAIDLELDLDLAAAGRSDDLTDTVDYAEIERRVVELAARACQARCFSCSCAFGNGEIRPSPGLEPAGRGPPLKP